MKLRTALVISIPAICLAGGIVLFIAARAGWLTPSEAVLRARYALPESRYLQIDGETVHVVDQGAGPAIVLIHGSFASLRMWNDWADALTERYRVVRFDRPRMGLSGPAPAGRAGHEQEIRIISALARELGLEQFFLVATSSSGVSAAAYAADHPKQIHGLVLANIAVGAIQAGPVERPAKFRFLLKIDPWFNGWRPWEFWRQVLKANFYDRSRIHMDLAREWAELNNRVQRMPPASAEADPMAKFEKTAGDLERMVVPTLLLWSDHDHELPVETHGSRGLALLGSQDKTLEVVANCGHMMPLECGMQSVPFARAFFDRITASHH